MDETQYAAWNSFNKQQWLGPYTFETVFRLYWGLKSITWSINGDGTSRYMECNDAHWNGTNWVSPPGPPPIPKTIFRWPNDTQAWGALNPSRNDTELATAPTNFVCPKARAFGPLTTTFLSDNRFYYPTTHRFTLFASRAPSGPGIAAGFAIRRTLTDEWWIPAEIQTRVFVQEPNPNIILVSFGDSSPAGGTGYFHPSTGFENPVWSQNSNSGVPGSGNANRPLLTLNVAGTSHTITENGQDYTLDVGMSHTITINLADPSQFF
jgi:hypothetical protein